MDTANNSHRLWLKIERFDLANPEENDKGNVKSLVIQKHWKHKEIDAAIRYMLNIPRQGVILKLRNQRSSLIALNDNLLPNTLTSPYILQVVKEHQFAKPKESFTQDKIDRYDQMYKNEITDVLHRVQILEDEIPELSRKKNEKLLKDIEELNRSLAFMKQRLSEYEFIDWNGMFKKHPLW